MQEHVSYNAATASFPIVPFVDGIPAVQARALTQKEKDWKFWSTSDYGKTASASVCTSHFGLSPVFPISISIQLD